MRKRCVSKKYDEDNLIECACGCKKIFPLYDKEGRKRRYILGHAHTKYEDKTQYKREWNHRNRKARYEYKKEYMHNRKKELIRLKGGKCVDCGIKYNGKNACIFDFHHKGLDKKAFLLGLNMLNKKAWKDILKEAQKCDLLCSNCHRMIIGSGY
jgi:hypothetical protein